MKKILFATMIAAGLLAVAGYAQDQTTPAPAKQPRASRRQERQQQRIGQGAQSGQLTPGETTRLERQEGAIHKEVAGDRAANGGKLTPAERRQVNRQQNRESKRIYRDKHNARVAPK